MKLSGDPAAVAYFKKMLCVSSVGVAALNEMPNLDVSIEFNSDTPTHYYRTKNVIFINKESLINKHNNNGKSICAALCHELFHYFHAMLDKGSSPDMFRLRKTSTALNKSLGDQEEELAITGNTLQKNMSQKNRDWRHNYYNENLVLEKLGLSKRISH